MTTVEISADAGHSLATGVNPLVLGPGHWVLSRRVRQSAALDVWIGVNADTGGPVLVRGFNLRGMNAGAMLRLEHEGALVARIRHPGLVPLVYVGREGGRLWLVSEFPPGPSLQEVLASGPSPSLLAALQLAASILSAVGELHQHGVVHAAIHPRGVLCGTFQSQVRLVWPGALETGSDVTSTPEELLDLARYAAPEQTQVIHGEVGETADLYAVGAILYRCLAGRAPFAAGDLNQLLWQQSTQPIQRLRQLGCDVPLVLDELLQRLLARDPGARYQSAEAVQYDLEQLIAAVSAGRTEIDLTIGTRDARRSLAPPAFIARQRELSILDEQIERTHAGLPRLTVIEGLSGYGKSRLLSEFAVRCAQSGLAVFEGRAVQEVTHPFQLLEGVASSFVMACQTDPHLAPRVRNRLRDQAARVASALPCLAALLLSEAREAVAPRTTESETLAALTEFLDALGSVDRPAVVIWDDCQWADDLVYRFLVRWQVLQAQRPPGERHVQLVVAFRSDEVPAPHPLRRIEPGVRVEIGPLGSAEVQRLVESMAGPLPAPAVEIVTRFAEGSPFMAAAILNGLVESRALVFESQQWRIDRLALEEVRSSSHAGDVLSKRISLLEGETRRLLQAGALLGSEFALEMAVHLTGLSSAQAWNAVNHARRRHLLWWSRQEGSCKFVHDKIREALLGSQSPDDKQRFHARAAEYLLAHAPACHADLALHLEAAGRSDTALSHALTAANDARHRHALELAEQQYRIAERTSVAAPSTIRFQIAEGLGDVLMLRGHYVEAERQFAAAERLADSDAAKAEVCCRRGELLIKRSDMRGALAKFEEGLTTLQICVPRGRVWIALRLFAEVLRQATHTLLRRWLVHRSAEEPDARERLKLRLYSGYSHAAWYCSQLPLLMWAHLRGMNCAERYQPSLELAQLYSDHAPGMTLVPWHRRGLRYADRSLAIRRDRQDLWGQGQSLHFAGVVHYAAGRYAEAMEACRQAVQILQRTGDYWQVHIARYQIAASLFHQGDLQGAIAEAQRNHASGLMVGDEQASGIILDVWARAAPGRVPEEILAQELARERHDFQGAAQVLLATAVQRIAQGRLTEAYECLQRAQAIIDDSGVRNPYTTPISAWMVTVLRTMAESEHTLDPTRRRQLLRQAGKAVRRALFESRWCRNDLPHIYRERALLQVMSGRGAAARRDFARSLELAAQSGALYETAQTLAQKARVGLELGWPEAEQEAEQARVLLARLQPAERASDDVRHENARVNVSLVDRFETLLKTGRGVVSALSREAVCQRVEDAALRLLRAEYATVVVFDGESDVPAWVPPEAVSLLEQVGQSGRVHTLPEVPGNLLSAMCAPIQVRGNIVACLYAIHTQLGSLFGPDEERLADFLATLAGAAFENAEGFAELEHLNATLEEKVAERTVKLRERAELLIRSNLDLERTTADLRVAQRELVASTRAAKLANEAKSRFLAAISHEIRTPMNGVIGMSELALATELSDRQRMYVSTISQSAKSLLAMLNDVLDFSKIEAGKLELEVGRINLHETIVDSVRLLSVSAWQKGLNLNCCIAPSVPSEVDADSLRLRQVLLNLIGNAIKFTAVGAVDVLADIAADGRLQLTIRDTGIGIAADRLSRIFQPFDQGEVSTTRRFGGSGLGLSISSELVALMGGRIQVDSAPGCGSTFRVLLPLSAEIQANALARTHPPAGRLAGRVLVLSRNATVLESHRETLSAWGLTVEAAPTIAEATLLLIGPQRPQLLLVDLPAQAGEELEFLDRLSAGNWLPESGAVLLVPAGAEDAVARVQSHGSCDVLLKPITPGELQQRIAARLQQPSQESTAVAVAGTESTSALRILVVDDSPVNQEVAAGLLELLGHQAVIADGGQAALHLLAAEAFDAVFMDVDMPDMDGITATRLWRSQEAKGGHRSTILAMSAHIADEVRHACLDAGMDGFLGKPVDPQELQAALVDVARRLGKRHRAEATVSEPADQADAGRMGLRPVGAAIEISADESAGSDLLISAEREHVG